MHHFVPFLGTESTLDNQVLGCASKYFLIHTGTNLLICNYFWCKVKNFLKNDLQKFFLNVANINISYISGYPDLCRPILSRPDTENIRIRQKIIRHGPMSLEP